MSVAHFSIKVLACQLPSCDSHVLYLLILVGWLLSPVSASRWTVELSAYPRTSLIMLLPPTMSAVCPRHCPSLPSAPMRYAHLLLLQCHELTHLAKRSNVSFMDNLSSTQFDMTHEPAGNQVPSARSQEPCCHLSNHDDVHSHNNLATATTCTTTPTPTYAHQQPYSHYDLHNSNSMTTAATTNNNDQCQSPTDYHLYRYPWHRLYHPTTSNANIITTVTDTSPPAPARDIAITTSACDQQRRWRWDNHPDNGQQRRPLPPPPPLMPTITPPPLTTSPPPMLTITQHDKLNSSVLPMYKIL